MSALQAFGGEVHAVFLDVGGVFHLPSPEIIGPALHRVGVDDGKLDPAVLDRAHYAGAKALEVWPTGDVRAGLWAAYERAYALEVGVAEDRLEEAIAELDAAFGQPGVWSRPAPGSTDGLRALADTGVTLAIVSNSDGTLEERLRAEGICQVGPGAGVPMTIVIDSDAVGVAKPDPAIFAIALEACGVPPERALHIGDTVGADVDGALAAGVRPLHRDPYGFCDDDSHPHVRDLASVAAALLDGAR
jgi:putative hydrolase of the HAD superfamily